MSAVNLASKRKRDSLPSAPVRAADSSFKTHHLLSQVQLCIDYLKTKGAERSFNDIVNYLSIQSTDTGVLNSFRRALQHVNLARIQYDPQGLNGIGSYRYNPIIPVRDADDLKRFLQRRPHSVALKIEDVKDGWPDAQAGVDAMEGRGELLVLRDKKGQIKALWQDDPTLHRPISDDLKAAWHDIKLPTNPDELREKLEAVGLKPTSAPRQVVKRTSQKDTKKRGPRKGGRTTNTHISHLLRDYTDQRK